MVLTVGVDVGGTKVLAGVVDAAGTVLARTRLNTPDRSQAPRDTEAIIFAALDDLCSSFDIAAVGVGAAGFVDESGTVLFAPHLSWRAEPIGSVLAERLGIPVVVDNDANTAARAEMIYGAGRGFGEAVCVTLGTGIGGALVVNGRVIRGSHGLAGEFGHMPMVPGGRSCECGQSGCWEQYCSGRALIRAAVQATGATGTGPAGFEITRAARAGAGWALDAFHEVGRWLGVGLAGLASAFDPAIIVVGGGLSEAGDVLLEPARDAFAERLPGGAHRPEVRILSAHLGVDAGFVGAASMAREVLG